MAHDIDKQLSLADYPVLLIKGMCMGIAEIIPGISGGTIAFLLGIYENFINAIKSLNLECLKAVLKFDIKKFFSLIAWRYLLVLVIGMLISIISLSHGITYLLEHQPVLIHSFFFGLILATAPIIARVITKWTIKKLIVTVLVSVATYFFVALVPISTPETKIFLFFSGFIAISAMILPGISGSFILLLLGKYHYILSIVNDRDFLSIAIFVLGIGVGIVTFVRVLSWLFYKYHDMTLAVLTGFVLGSLNKIWPWKKTLDYMLGSHGEMIPIKQVNYMPQQFNQEIMYAIAALCIGLFCAFILNRADGSSFKNLHKSGK